MMLTFQDLLLQIDVLKDQGITYDKIGKSLNPPLPFGRVNYLYSAYVRPFYEKFRFMIKELNWDHLVKQEEECRMLVYLILSHVKKGNKFRNVKLLTPIVTYLVFRLKGEMIKTGEFCQVSNITLINFKEGLRLIIPIYLEFSDQGREKHVLDLIEGINSELSLDPIPEFYIESLKTLHISSMNDSLAEFTSFYQSIRERMEECSKYKALEVSGPIIVYMFLKIKGILITLPAFLEACQLNYKEFTMDLKKMITRYYPEYIRRDKTLIVKTYIITIFNSFYHPNEALFSNALLLHDHFHRFLHHAKEEVIAAVICILTMISCDLPGIRMASICNKAGITQSTLNLYFLERIIPYLGIPDSITLKSAFSLIKREIQEKIPLRKVIVTKKISISPRIPSKNSKKISTKISPTINRKLIFDYLGNLLDKIKENMISEVNQSLLDEIMYYVSDIKLNIHEIVRLLKERNEYKKEEHILSTAIYISCPFINVNITGKILFHALHRKTNYKSISRLLNQISLQKIHVRHIFLPYKHAGRVLEQGRTDIKCPTCGNHVYLLRYADNMITACKQCLQKASN